MASGTSSTSGVPGSSLRVMRFFLRFLTDDAFRFKVLYRERDWMAQEGLTPEEIDTLTSMDSTAIMQLLNDEVQAWGANLDKARKLVWEGMDCDCYFDPKCTGADSIESAARYSQGQIHVRCPNPTSVARSQTAQPVEIIGHGFDLTAEIQFKLGAQERICRPTVAPSAGYDLFQHVEVSVVLDTPGQWEIRGRNDPAEQFDVVTLGFGTITVT